MMRGEDEITRWFASQSRLAPETFPIGIGDDMAEIRIGDQSVLVTTDMLLDGVHFELGQASLEQIGYKAMAVSLSDCAAMATVPVAAVVAVGLPKGFGQDELKRLHAGIVEAGRRFGCELVGGDITVWSGPERLVISVAMLSRPGPCVPVRRSGARVGDCICVTGRLGGAVCGKHLRFEPRVAEALRMCELVELHSMIDISDGLSSDLHRICRLSGVGAVIEASEIPIDEAARARADPLESALHEGEDFELLFTLGPGAWKRLRRQWDLPVELSQIGEVTEGPAVLIKTPDGQLHELRAGGYDHLG